MKNKLLTLILSFFTAISSAQLSVSELASLIYLRVAGVPLPLQSEDGSPHPLRVKMENLIKEGKLQEAAYEATSEPTFYSITLVSTFVPYSNPDKSTKAPLNDFTALIAGVAKEEDPKLQFKLQCSL